MVLGTLPPPYGVPFINATTGKVDPQWEAYLLSLSTAVATDFAPADGPYVTFKADGTLTGKQNIGLLASGFLKSTQALGVATLSTVVSVPGTDITGAALTRTNDTNVTLTLGGSASTALLRAASITAGWSGQLGVARGGTGASLSATGGASQVLRQSSSGAAVTVSQLATTDISGLASSTYTPTLTAVANVAASTAYPCQYARNGSVVTFSGKVDIDPTSATTLTRLGISLPVASNFGNDYECAGTAVAPAMVGTAAALLADAANNRAELQFTTTADVANRSWYFVATFQVI